MHKKWLLKKTPISHRVRAVYMCASLYLYRLFQMFDHCSRKKKIFYFQLKYFLRKFIKEQKQMIWEIVLASGKHRENELKLWLEDFFLPNKKWIFLFFTSLGVRTTLNLIPNKCTYDNDDVDDDDKSQDCVKKEKQPKPPFSDPPEPLEPQKYQSILSVKIVIRSLAKKTQRSSKASNENCCDSQHCYILR